MQIKDLKEQLIYDFETKFGMCFQPFGEKLDEAKSFVDHAIQSAIKEREKEIINEIKEKIELSLAYGDEYCESEDCHWEDARSIVDSVLSELSKNEE